MKTSACITTAPTLLALLLAAGPARATIPDRNGIYWACYDTQHLNVVRLIDYPSKKCALHQKLVSWGINVAVCRGRPGGICSNKPLACAYDKDCGSGGTCEWRASFARFVDNGNGTVTDRRTCLTWEKKTGTYTPGAPARCLSDSPCPDPHGVNNTYFWSDGTPWDLDGPVVTEFLAKLNAAAFAGYTDWRLPTTEGTPDEPTGNDPELESILLPTTCPDDPAPCIDTTVFGPTAAWAYWTSSSPYEPGATPWFAWTVHFGWACTFNNSYCESTDIGAYARAVRGP